MPSKCLLNWSGGKDSTMALSRLLADDSYEVVKLATTVSEESGRISMHGVHYELLKAQCKAIEIPVEVITIPFTNKADEYARIMREFHESNKTEGIYHSAFGDIFLEDLRKYREDNLETIGINAVFPIWQENTSDLVEEFIDKGFKAVVVAVDGSKLDASFAGRMLDRNFLNDLPPGIDPCGENGEFHSFVFDGPMFKNEVGFRKMQVVEKQYPNLQQAGKTIPFYFQELVLS